MFFWAVVMAAVALATLAGGYYLSLDIYELRLFDKLKAKSKTLAHLAALVIVLALFAVAWLFFSVINAAIILLHLVVFRFIASLAGYLTRKMRKIEPRRSYLASVSAVFVVIYLAFGAYSAFHVTRTEYKFTTEKTSSPFRAVLIADTHIGATFDGEGFADHIAVIMEETPDAVFICGDFVDDSTELEDMIDACAALAPLAKQCKVIYVFGNHDKGYYDKTGRGYTGEDLLAELLKNGVIVLQDEIYDFGNGFCVIGRKDRSDKKRLDIADLVGEAGEGNYTIVLDHQPHDYANEAAAGVDLVLSGHTHGGQLIPITHVGEWIGENDNTYGHERRENTDFIVTSGLADWEIIFKTGCVSEYVVIDINR